MPPLQLQISQSTTATRVKTINFVLRFNFPPEQKLIVPATQADTASNGAAPNTHLSGQTFDKSLVRTTCTPIRRCIHNSALFFICVVGIVSHYFVFMWLSFTHACFVSFPNMSGTFAICFVVHLHLAILVSHPHFKFMFLFLPFYRYGRISHVSPPVIRGVP